MAMQKPPHLSHLSRDLEWYISEHNDRQSDIGNSRVGPTAYTIHQLLKRNKFREYKGVHRACHADELGEVLTCVIFKRVQEDKPTEYFHTLYLGPNTDQPELVHNEILERLGLDPDQYQKSLISCC